MAGIVDRAVLSYAQMPDSAKIAMLSEAIAQLQSEMAVVNSRIEEIDGDFPQQILIGGGDDSAGDYASYFKVIDASDGDGCKIGVTNGSAVMLDPVGNCGTVKINNERADVAAVTKALSAAGTYYVWIHCWIDAEEGPKSEIIVGDVDDDDPPDNVNAGIAFSSHLAGRVQVTKADGVYSIAGITQDYLRGGEYETWLWGDCTGLELEE